MASCTLEVGDRVVLLAKGGPPEAEFALFDAGDIELASSGPGQVREIGYRTTADEALRRLEAVGVTRELAEETAAAMIPVLASVYARGPVARRVSSLLGPGELFDGATYDFELRRYEGRWMDLPALAMDLELSRATTLMQSLSLVTLLGEVAPRTVLLLTTREYAAERRPGERSHRRVPLEHVVNLRATLHTLSTRGKRAPSPEREVGPSTEELTLALEERATSSSDGRVKDRISSILGAMTIRQKPAKGPLAAPELWALEEQLSAGNAAGVIEQLDAVEKRTGRSPATSYLRARAALLTGRDSPRTIAERASGLAMSMTSFAECELLAAEAWTAAGEPKRAVPFARDLVANKDAHAEIRTRAQQIIEAAERPSPAVKSAAPAPSRTPKAMSSVRPPPMTLPPPFDPDPEPAGQPRTISDELTLNVHNPSSYPPKHPARPSPDATPPPRKETPPLPYGRPAPAEASDLPPILALSPPPPITAPGSSPISAPTPASSPASGAPRKPGGTQTLGGPPPASPQERAAQSFPTPRPIPKAASVRPSAAPPSPAAQLRKASWAVETLMRGASQPPYRSDSPGAHAYIPKAPRVPSAEGAPELAESLALPPGLTGTAAPLETLPSSVIDARVQFTFLARELAREYREERGVELRIDLESVEAMQAYLFERYRSPLRSVEEAVDVRKHGALLSEILARRIDAFWVDIAPSDLGYWAMVVPPDTRVWPFGRILRLIAMQHRERDLVAYFLELEARAR